MNYSCVASFPVYGAYRHRHPQAWPFIAKGLERRHYHPRISPSIVRNGASYTSSKCVQRWTSKNIIPGSHPRREVACGVNIFSSESSSCTCPTVGKHSSCVADNFALHCENSPTRYQPDVTRSDALSKRILRNGSALTSPQRAQRLRFCKDERAYAVCNQLPVSESISINYYFATNFSNVFCYELFNVFSRVFSTRILQTFYCVLIAFFNDLQNFSTNFQRCSCRHFSIRIL